MNIAYIDWVFALTMGVVFAYVFYTFQNSFESGRERQQVASLAPSDKSFAELALRITPEYFFLLQLALAAVGILLGVSLSGIVIGAFGGVLGYFLPSLYLHRLRAKRIRKIELQLIEGLELLGNSLKSGLTLPQATELLVREFPAPINQEFSLLLAECRLGVDFTDALENMAKRLNSNIVSILATGVAITKRCGGDVSVIFSNIAQTIRDRATIEGKLEAVTAQGRFQGLILGLMPFALVVVLYFIDRQHVLILFSTQIGIWAFSGVCIMVILAQLWIRKLLQIDV